MLEKFIGFSVVALLPISLVWAALGIAGIAGSPGIIAIMLLSVLIALLLLSLIAGWLHDRRPHDF
jgi:uncharacterized membrane protein YtjA (UPF0391 family)